MALYCAVQALVASRTLGYFPEGFATEGFYHPLARNLLEHGRYALLPTDPSITDRPPLYPVILAALYGVFGADEVVGVLFNNALLTILLVLTFLLGRRLHPAAAVIGPVLVMLDTVFLAQANRNQSDMLFACLATSFVLLAVRSLQRPLSLSSVALAAVALAAAVFTRAVGMYLWLAYAAALFFAFARRERLPRLLGAIALVCAVQAAVVLPWMARNYSIGGNADYAGMKGHHLTSFYAPLFLAKRDGMSPKDAKRRLWEQIEADPAYQAADKGGRERYLAELGARLAVENLPGSLFVLVDNLPQLFLSYPSEPLAVLLPPERFERWSRFDDERHAVSFNQDSWAIGPRIEQALYYWRSGLVGVLAYGVFLKAINALTLLLAASAVVLVWRDARPEARRAVVLLGLYAAILTLLSILATQGRFRLPIMPALAVLAGYGAALVAPVLQGRARKSGSTAAGSPA